MQTVIPKISSASCIGIQAVEVTIEVDDAFGLPSIQIVGLPDQSIKESKDRIRSAIVNSGFDLPGKKYTVNLAPSDVRKEGAGFDLPIALGMLSKLGYLQQSTLDRYAFIGELALDGTIRPVNGTLAMALGFKRKGKTFVVPEDNYQEAALQSDVEVVAVKNLRTLVAGLRKDCVKNHAMPMLTSARPQRAAYACVIEDIKGQQAAKRALEVAVSGSHNMIMVGPPGSGKTLLAKSIPSLLPDPTDDELLEIVRIYSLRVSVTKQHFIRPFRAPHHSISAPAMVGSGPNPKPGEVSLAHNGVLFLDEFPEFPRTVLETMRGPLEDRTVTISRAKDTITYPAKFMLICAMNPCPCGFSGDPDRPCRCSYDTIVKYRARLSGPILDRIDIHIDVPRISQEELKAKSIGESSDVVRARIEKVRQVQCERYKSYGFHTNADLPPKLIEKYCHLDPESERLLDMAVKELHLSTRAYHRILKLARTIADMAGNEQIQIAHVSEAIQYRTLDRQG